MAIETLGKSLLASAKKKSQKGAKLGQIAGLFMLGAYGANSLIRKKAKERAMQWSNSLLPIQQQLKGEFKTIGKFKKEYNSRTDQEKYVNVDESFIKPMEEHLLKIAQASGNEVNKDIIRKEAIAMTQDDITAFNKKAELYSPYFDIEEEEFNTKLANFSKLGVKEIQDDNLWKWFGRQFSKTDAGKQTMTSVMLDTTQNLSLDVPSEIAKNLDVSFLTALGNVNNRQKEVVSIEADVIDELIELNNNDDELKAFYKRVTKPKAGKEFKVDTRVDSEIDLILSQTWDNPATPIKREEVNPYFIGNILVADTENGIKSEMPIKNIIEQLQTTYQGEKIVDRATQPRSDWDIMRNDIRELTQKKMLEYINTPNSGAIDNSMIREFATESFNEVAKQLQIQVTGGDWFDFKFKKETVRYLPTLVPVDTKLTGEEETILTNFNSYMKSPSFINGTDEQKSAAINNLLSKYPKLKGKIKMPEPSDAGETPINMPQPKETVIEEVKVTRPTQEDMKNLFQISGMDKQETDSYLESLLNQREDLTDEEYNQLLQYFNKENEPVIKTEPEVPQPAPSLLSKTDDKELTDSEMISKNLSKYAEDAVTISDILNTNKIKVNITRAERSLENLKNKNVQVKTALARAGLSRSEDFNNFLNTKGMDIDSFRDVDRPTIVKTIKEYLDEKEKSLT